MHSQKRNMRGEHPQGRTHTHKHTHRRQLNQGMQEWHQHHGKINVFYCLSHKEHWLRQSHTDKRAFVKVQEFSGEFPAHHWAKRSRTGWIEEGKNISLCSHHPFHKAAQLSAKRSPRAVIFPVRENESIRLRAWLPQLQGMPPRRPTSFPSHPEHWGVLHN